MEIERYNRDMKRASQVNFTDPSQQNLIAVLANLLQTQVPQNMTQFNSNHRGSMYPEDQMMSMMGGPKPQIGNKFCMVTTSTVNETEINKLCKLGLRPEDINSLRQRDKDDRNPVIEETGYVGMTTWFGIRVVGIAFRLEFIQDSELTKPREIHLEFADLEAVKSPPLAIANTWKDDKWDPTNIYRLEVKN